MPKERKKNIAAKVGQMKTWDQATKAATWLVWQQENGNLTDVRHSLYLLGPLATIVLLEMSVQMTPELRAHLCENLVFGLEGDEPPMLPKPRQLRALRALAELQVEEESA